LILKPTIRTSMSRWMRTPTATRAGGQGVGKVRYVRPDLRRWQAEARIGSLGRPCGSLPAR
jgi:hypothetical protein